MKTKILFGVLLLCVISLINCSKSSDSTPSTPSTVDYANLASGTYSGTDYSVDTTQTTTVITEQSSSTVNVTINTKIPVVFTGVKAEDGGNGKVLLTSTNGIELSGTVDGKHLTFTWSLVWKFVGTKP